jgi:hypothetical protein
MGPPNSSLLKEMKCKLYIIFIFLAPLALRTQRPLSSFQTALSIPESGTQKARSAKVVASSSGLTAPDMKESGKKIRLMEKAS